MQNRMLLARIKDKELLVPRPHTLKGKYEIVLQQYLKTLGQNSKKLDLKNLAGALVNIHLETYLSTRDWMLDFHKVRKLDPKWALTFAAERVMGKLGAYAGIPGSATKDTPAQIAILVQVLSGTDKPKKGNTKAVSPRVQHLVVDSEIITDNQATS